METIKLEPQSVAIKQPQLKTKWSYEILDELKTSKPKPKLAEIIRKMEAIEEAAEKDLVSYWKKYIKDEADFPKDEHN